MKVEELSKELFEVDLENVGLDPDIVVGEEAYDEQKLRCPKIQRSQCMKSWFYPKDYTAAKSDISACLISYPTDTFLILFASHLDNLIRDYHKHSGLDDKLRGYVSKNAAFNCNSVDDPDNHDETLQCAIRRRAAIKEVE